MPSFDKIIQNVVESLYGDERLRSNLTDSEAKIVLDWAAGWITEQVNAARDEASAKEIVQTEMTRVRQTVNGWNALAAKDAIPRLTDAIDAIDAGAQAATTLTREQVLSLATKLASSLWTVRLRAGK